ncbi:MAG: LytTR family DNA-binding domain-containing protein [Rhodothermales bacterium]
MPKNDDLRILIVDDEPLARQRLEDLLSPYPEAVIVDQIDNGADAVAVLRDEEIDLVFLDVQMPRKTGLEVVEEVGAEDMPLTIFVTAYDRYALRAFDVAAVDYLLKPFDDERFEQAYERAKKTLRLKEVDAVKDRLLALFRDDDEVEKAQQPYLERVAVDMRGKVRVVPVEQIDYISASGPYAELHTDENTFLIREQMQTLEERLNPADFFRIHRSTIVRLNLIESLHHAPGGDYAITLKNGQRLKVSRGRRDELAQRLGLENI